jgi:putative tryptophan/tyrosine transport system substrate-binding protein
LLTLQPAMIPSGTGQMTIIGRRKFITALGSAAAWPLAVRAQQSERLRRVGVLMSTPDDSLGQAWFASLAQGLQQLGWEAGRNVQIDTRWGAGDTERFRRYAAELVALGPDVLVGTANSIVSDLQQASRAIPIVFVLTIDPVGSGLVASLAHPGGNSTGFTAFEFSLNAKLLDLLKEIMPDVKRVAVVRDGAVPAGSGGFASIQTAASSSGVELTPIGVHDAEEIERGIADFASRPNGGLIVVGPPSSMASYRNLIAPSRPGTIFPRFTLLSPSSAMARWSHMEAIKSINFAARQATSIASLRARSQRTCQYRRRPNSNWSSI